MCFIEKVTAIGRVTAIGYRPAIGCDIYVKEDIACIRRLDLEPTDVEIVVIKFFIPSTPWGQQNHHGSLHAAIGLRRQDSIRFSWNSLKDKLRRP